MAVVVAAGGNHTSLVEIKVFLKDGEKMVREDRNLERSESRKSFSEAYSGFFAQYGMTAETNNLPARTLVWVSEVPLEFPTEDTLVEITATAAIPKKLKF